MSKQTFAIRTLLAQTWIRTHIRSPPSKIIQTNSRVKHRLVDLSVPLENDVPADPPGNGPKIEYLGHEDTTKTICQFFPGLKPEDLRAKEGWAVELINLSTHN